MAMFIWLMALAAAAVAAYLRGLDMMALLPYGLCAVMPVIITTLLWPVIHHEWTKIVVVFSWLAMAIIACLGVSFVPMAILFLCAPTIAAHFQNEIVIEALIAAALLAGILYYAGHVGVLPEAIANAEQMEWVKKAGIMATLFMMVGSLFAAARAPSQADLITQNWQEGGAQNKTSNLQAVSGAEKMRAELCSRTLATYPGSVLHIDGNDKVTLLSDTDIIGLSLNETTDLASGNAGVDKKEDDVLLGFGTGLLSLDVQAQSQILDVIKLSRREDHVQDRVIAARSEDDDLTYLDIRALPLKDGDVGLFIQDMSKRGDGDFMREITSNIEIIEEISGTSEDDKMRSRNLYFAGVSHELRTPLNAIIGFSDMMRSRLFGPLPGKYAEYADLIHDSGQHMLDLIGDVLDLSKIEAGKYQLVYDEFDLADVIRSSIKMMRPVSDTASVRLDAEIAIDDDLSLVADRKAVRQILLNLISNAVKFLPKGGRVVVGSKKAGDTIHLSVSDNGAGMSTQELERVGQPYEQTQSGQTSEKRGSGLGLSLVKSLTELHQGRFAIASQQGEGTTVDIYLPVDADFNDS